MNIDWAALGNLVIVSLLGGMVGSGELISRYRDNPGAALWSAPGMLYIVLNAAAACAALLLIRAFGWTFGATGDSVGVTQVLVAGFGAMAVFRSSLFTVRIGEQDVAIGPSSFLHIALAAADREVDRRRAIQRAKRAKEIMEGVLFKKVKDALPTFCIALMQNLPVDEQERLVTDVDRLETINEDEIDDRIKAYILGTAVMNFVGEDVLRAAVEALKNGAAPQADIPGGDNGPA